MHLTEAQLHVATRQVEAVRDGVLRAFIENPAPPGLDADRHVLSTIDGLIAGIATLVETSGIAPTNSSKRHLADELRKGFLKALKEARAEMAETAAYAH